MLVAIEVSAHVQRPILTMSGVDCVSAGIPTDSVLIYLDSAEGYGVYSDTILRFDNGLQPYDYGPIISINNCEYSVIIEFILRLDNTALSNDYDNTYYFKVNDYNEAMIRCEKERLFGRCYRSES